MAPHSCTLAWKIPWTEEPSGLQSMGSLGVGHDWTTSLSLFTFMHWRRKWQPTPGFLPGESQGWGRLVGCRLWGHTESGTNEVISQQQQMNLEDTILSEISQLQTNTGWYHLYVESKKVQFRETVERWLSEAEVGWERNEEMLIKGYRLSVVRWVSLKI